MRSEPPTPNCIASSAEPKKQGVDVPLFVNSINALSLSLVSTFTAVPLLEDT
jgi:hypothetical protein